MKDKLRAEIKSDKDFLKYFKMSVNYSNKYFWYLLLLAIAPSVLTVFVFSPYGTIEYFCNFRRFYGTDFQTLYLVASGINPKLFYLGIVGLVVIPVFYSILFGAVERHMRVGEFNLGFDRILTRLNFNYLTALKFSLTLFVVYEIFKFLQVVMFYLLAHSLQIGWAFGLSIVWYVVLYAVELFLLASTVLWVPTMLQTGLSSAKAMGLAIRQGTKQILPTMVSFMIPTLPMLILMVVNSVLNLKLDIVLDAILLTISVVFYVIYMYSMFFDINGIEREDLKKTDIWKEDRKHKKGKKNGN